MLNPKQTSFILAIDEKTGQTQLVPVNDQNQTPVLTQFVPVNNENVNPLPNTLSETKDNGFIQQNDFATMNANSSRLRKVFMKVLLQAHRTRTITAQQ